MINLALTGLESAINCYLKLDPETISRLAELEGKTYKVEVSDWNFSYYLTPHTDGVTLSSDPVHDPCTIIKGDLFGLCRVGKEGGSGSSLFANKIEISGDTESGEKLRDVLKKIDIDWEEHLSSCMGDAPAHGLAWRVKKMLGIGQSVKQNLGTQIKDYLQHEKQIFPTREQAEQFYQDVTQIRDDVERTEARIKLLEAKHKQ